MTGKVASNLPACPDCKELFEDLPTTPRFCPYCAFQIIPFEKLDLFKEGPDYLNLQEADFRKQAEKEMTSLESTNDGDKPVPKEQLIAAMYDYISNCKDSFIKGGERADFYGAAMDALDHYRLALQAPNLQRTDMQEFVVIGKRIGELAESIDKNIKNGGATAYELAKAYAATSGSGGGDTINTQIQGANARQ